MREQVDPAGQDVAKGIGLTAGKSHIDNGHGKFTDVYKIDDVLGDDVQAGAPAGVVKSGSAQVLTKGTVSLALAGDGERVNLGIDVGKFTISKVDRSAKQVLQPRRRLGTAAFVP